jgi:hypothetical protein
MCHFKKMRPLALALLALVAIAHAEEPVGTSDREVSPYSPGDENGFFDFFPEWVQRGLVGEYAIDSQAGTSVAISGDTLAFGAPHAGQNEQGNVQIWRRNGADWTIEAVLDSAQAGAHFGAAIDLSGDRLIVGAPGYDLSQFNQDVGRAYIFHRDGANWNLAAQLELEFNTSNAPNFGHAVAISGDSAVVGAPFAYSGPNAYGYAGFYRWDGFDWNLLMGAVGGDDGEQFGESVDVVDRRNFGADLDDYAVIGSPGRDLGANGPFASGAAQVFRLTVAGVLEPWQELPFPDPTTFSAFGSAVAITSSVLFETRIAIGAPGRDLHGKVLTYEISGGQWQLAQELGPVEGETFDRFGGAVALAGDRIVVGADGDDFEGDGGDVEDAGSVYFFHNISGLWFRNDRKTLRTVSSGDRFGSAVAISGIHAAAGGGHVNGGGGNETGIVVEYIVDRIFYDGFD